MGEAKTKTVRDREERDGVTEEAGGMIRQAE